MMKRRYNKKGFTLIELLLSMAILATMLVAIATLTMRILDIYRKGLTMRAINAVGRDIISDLSRTISGSPVVDNINPTPNGGNINWAAVNLAYKKYYNESFRRVNTTSSQEVQAGGVFCTGSYTYIWNTAPTISEYREDVKDGSINVANYYTIKTDDGNDVFYKFARVPDSQRLGCETVSDTDTRLKTTNLIYTGIHDSDVVELIGDDEVDLAIYDFMMLPATQNNKTGQILYSGTFVLATTRGGVNVLANGDYCTGKKTEDLLDDSVENTRYDMNYCSVNKFNFAMRATGESYSSDQYGERQDNE